MYLTLLCCHWVPLLENLIMAIQAQLSRNSVHFTTIIDILTANRSILIHAPIYMLISKIISLPRVRQTP